ncbi:MAG: DCC1-like thiol-disulfide oxidoreductase family protein [Nitrospira sp.]|nr:DCC1-like thiol-disulfide oxidoreductase family protein [Nitrospira sp.]
MNPDGDLWMGMKRIRLPLVMMCVALGLWIVFADLVVPSVIESAHRGQSFPVFNGLIKGHATHSVDEYLRDWDQLAWRTTVASTVFGLLGLLVFMMATSPTFFRKFVGEATPGTLGAIRAWTCGILLLWTVIEDLPSIAWLPVEGRNPVGVMGWLYALPIGFDKLVASEAGLHVFQFLTELLLFLGMIGYRTRLVIPLGAVCFALLGGILRDYSFNWHQGWVPLYLITILSFTPCGDGWSVDRLLRVVRGQPVPDPKRAVPVYGWARYTCWVAIAVTYWETGLCKLRGGGLSWGSADGLRATFYEDTLLPREYPWSWSLSLIQAPDALFVFLGLFVLVFESFWIAVLFSKTVRRYWPILTATFHTGVLFLQKILFIDLILLQALFYDFTGIRKTIARRLETVSGPIQILFDGHCPLCNRTVRVLGFFDLFTRLEFIDFRRLDLAEYNRRHQLALTIEDLDREMYVISRGQVYVGYYGYRVLSRALPAFWLLSPLLYIPGVSWFGERVYGYIARHRLALLHCDTHCPTVPSGTTDLRTTFQVSEGPQAFRYAWLISVFCVVMAVSYFYRVEFYPVMTSWHLYASLNYSGEISYFKAVGRQASGAVIPVRVGDSVGALRYDGRDTPLLKKCFSGHLDEKGASLAKDLETCQKFLILSGAIYNKNSPSDRKISQLELQEWVWNFRSNPSDPEHGEVRSRVVVEIEPVSAAAKQET